MWNGYYGTLSSPLHTFLKLFTVFSCDSMDWEVSDELNDFEVLV